MIILAETITLIDALAIILSVVSLIITIVGFFASLKFYRDGVDLQKSANEALTKLEEKTAFIQTQVGGMFDKTLDAAIGKRAVLSENFADLNDQLEQTKTQIVEETLKQIGDAGEQERRRLSQVVGNQIELVRQKVESTRESAEDLASESMRVHRNSMAAALLNVIPKHDMGLPLPEIVSRSGLPNDIAGSILNKFIEAGIVEKLYQGGNALYRANAEKVKSALYG